MQASLMFVDLKPLGLTPDSQKIAIKMPRDPQGGGEAGDTGFSDIIDALMAMPPDQIQDSLGKMDWVDVQGDGTGFARLLDLSGDAENGNQTARMLIGNLAADTPRQPLVATLEQQPMAPVENGQAVFSKPVVDGQAAFSKPVVDGQAAFSKPVVDGQAAFSNSVAGDQTVFSKSVVDDQTALSRPIAKVPAAPQMAAQTPSVVGAEPAPAMPSEESPDLFRSEIVPDQGNGKDQFKAFRNDALPDSKTPVPSEGALTEKPVTEKVDTHAAALKPISARPEKTELKTAPPGPPEGSGVNSKDLPLSGADVREMADKTEKMVAPVISRAVPNQGRADTGSTAQPAMDHAIKGQSVGQALADGANPEPGDQFSRESRAASTPVRSQAFRPAEWEGALAGADETSDSTPNIKHDAREMVQQATSRISTGTEMKSVGVTTSGHEPPPPANDAQTQIIRQIVQRMSLHNQGSQSTMTLKLKPAFLGNVHMQISTENQQVVVRMATESLAVKEMVEQGLQYLKSEMQQHGLEIDKFDVFVSDDKESSHPGQDLAGFRQALKQRQKNAKNNGSDDRREDATDTSEGEKEDRRVTDDTNEIDYFA